MCARRLDELIDGESDLNARMMAASTLFNYLNWTTKGDSADALVARIEPILAEPEVTPLMQVWWRTHLSFWHHVNGRYEQAAAVIGEAREIAERYGLVAYLFEIDHAVASALISKGDYAAAGELLQAMERRLSPARRMDWAYFHHLQANLEQRLGHFGNAAKAAEQAVDLARETGLPSVQLPHFLARLAHSRISAGDREGGMRAMDEAIATASDVDRKTFEQQRELVLVDEDIAAGRNAARDRASRRRARGLPDARAKSCSCAIGPDLAARLANLRAPARHRNRIRAHADRAQRARCAGRRGARVAVPAAHPRARRIRADSRRTADALHRQGAAASARSPEAPGRARRQRRRHASS